VKGSQILRIDVAYQKDVDELRKSTSRTLLKPLTAGGAKLDYKDLCFPSVRAAGAVKPRILA
jgi:UDP-N-acetyl-D-mannosaminuronate dehydrogenase